MNHTNGVRGGVFLSVAWRQVFPKLLPQLRQTHLTSLSCPQAEAEQSGTKWGEPDQARQLYHHPDQLPRQSMIPREGRGPLIRGGEELSDLGVCSSLHHPILPAA